MNGPTRLSKADVLRDLHEVQAQSPSCPFKSIVGEPLRLVGITGPHTPLPTTLNQNQPFYALSLVDDAGALYVVWSAHAALVKYWQNQSLRTLLRQGGSIWIRIDQGTTKKGMPAYTLEILESPDLDAAADEDSPADLPYE